MSRNYHWIQLTSNLKASAYP